MLPMNLYYSVYTCLAHFTDEKNPAHLGVEWSSTVGHVPTKCKVMGLTLSTTAHESQQQCH